MGSLVMFDTRKRRLPRRALAKFNRCLDGLRNLVRHENALDLRWCQYRENRTRGHSETGLGQGESWPPQVFSRCCVGPRGDYFARPLSGCVAKFTAIFSSPRAAEERVSSGTSRARRGERGNRRPTRVTARPRPMHVSEEGRRHRTDSDHSGHVESRCEVRFAVQKCS